MENIAAARITSKESEALQYFIGSGALAAARLEKQKAALAKRKVVRARLEPLPGLKEDLAKKSKIYAAATEKVNQARMALHVATNDADAAYIELRSLENQCDRLQHSVRWDLSELADPRVQDVARWLDRLRQVARNGFQSEQHFERRMRGVYLKIVTNVKAMETAIAAIAKAEADLDDVVMVSNALDVGPELERIKDAVLEAFKPLIDGVALTWEKLPQLNLAQ